MVMGYEAFRAMAEWLGRQEELGGEFGYSIQVWEECRRNAVAFLAEANARLNDAALRQALEEVERHMRAAHSHLRSIADTSRDSVPKGKHDEYAGHLREAYEEEKKAIELVETILVFDNLELALANRDLADAKDVLNGYVSSDIFNPHHAANIVDGIITYPELLEIAERIVDRSIRENTIENLGKIDPRMATVHKQSIDYCWLYSQYAWLSWKKRQYREAQTRIEKAFSYLPSPLLAGPTELMRLGIISHDNGSKQDGWENIKRALLADTQIERRDGDYTASIQRILTERSGDDGVDLARFLDDMRRENREPLPDLSLVSFGGQSIDLENLQGTVVFVNFLSPSCGTCRQQIRAVRNIYDTYFEKEDVAFIFVLNNPDLKEEARQFFGECGFREPTLTTVGNGSAWDYVADEPSIWVTDRHGRIAVRHVGYEQGDESILQQELLDQIGEDA